MTNASRLLSHFMIAIVTLGMIACDSNSSSSEVAARPAEQAERKSVTPPPFDTTITFQQFQTEFNAYAKRAASQHTPPHPCSDYMIRFVANSINPVENRRMQPVASLCNDISTYEKANSKGLVSGSWHYTFMPIGERYYVIEGMLLDKSRATVTYYYERKN